MNKSYELKNPTKYGYEKIKEFAKENGIKPITNETQEMLEARIRRAVKTDEDRDFFEERAAIHEYDGKAERKTAEFLALSELLEKQVGF